MNGLAWTMLATATVAANVASRSAHGAVAQQLDSVTRLFVIFLRSRLPQDHSWYRRRGASLVE
jgi:hypothetical protein